MHATVLLWISSFLTGYRTLHLPARTPHLLTDTDILSSTWIGWGGMLKQSLSTAPCSSRKILAIRIHSTEVSRTPLEPLCYVISRNAASSFRTTYETTGAVLTLAQATCSGESLYPVLRGLVHAWRPSGVSLEELNLPRLNTSKKQRTTRDWGRVKCLNTDTRVEVIPGIPSTSRFSRATHSWGDTHKKDQVEVCVG